MDITTISELNFLNFYTFYHKNVENVFEKAYLEHFDQLDISHRTGQSRILQYCRCAGGGCGHIESGTTIY